MAAVNDMFREVQLGWSWTAIASQAAVHIGSIVVLAFLFLEGVLQYTSVVWTALLVFIGLVALGTGVLVSCERGQLSERLQERMREQLEVAGLFLATIGGLGVLVLLMVFGFGAFPFSAWVLFVVLFLYSSIGITVGYHRFATHRAFLCGKWFGRFLLAGGALALQKNIFLWAREHLVHHARTEIEAQDPHTPREGLWHAHIGWILRPYIYPESVLRMFSRGLEHNPLIREQSHYYSYVVTGGLLLPFFLVGLWSWRETSSLWIGLLEGGKAFLLVGMFRLLLTYHITFAVNSVSHKWGAYPYQNALTGDSRDAWPLALVSLGETLQGIHHRFPSAAFYWVRWYYLDLSGIFVVVLSWVGRFCPSIGLPYNLKYIRKQDL